ncbi:MAG: tRNA pseudouridine synthase A [Bacteroidetes bacterium]|jgi:tRNA pseudouridine38-40 synthase|nr:tRNA pseudouridine synthase A [Bacteroidota bacterium]
MQKTRYFFQIAYNGANYNGWQIQPNATTVQGVFEDCLSKKLHQPIRSYGCGRTDTGVHARQFFVQFDTDLALDHGLVREMNAFLPRDIACIHLYRVAAHLDHYRLHARFDAYERQYEYILSRRKDPFGIGTKTIFYQQELDLEAMQAAAQILPKYVNYKAFSKLESPDKSYEVKLNWATWEVRGDDWVFQVNANRFLRSMVRKLVGTMVWLGSGRMDLAQFESALASADPSKTGIVAPPDGLYLVQVKYPDNALEKL